MSHSEDTTPSPVGQSLDNIDWRSIEADAKRKLAARFRQIRDTASIDSAVHLALAVVYAMISVGKVIENIPAMVWTVAYNTLCAEMKRAYNRNEVTNVEWERDVGRASPSPEDELLTQDLQEALYAAIFELPEYYRVPLVASVIEGMSYQDIQRITGMNPGTARNNVSKAKKMVRAKMEQQGYSETPTN